MSAAGEKPAPGGFVAGPWLVLIAVLAAAWLMGGPGGPAAVNGRAAEPLALSEVLSAAPEGFAVAARVRPFRFPEDHGPHPDFRSEWWYFTGNLNDPGGRRFGFQLTFFRFALAPRASAQPATGSRWRTRQVYMAHLAVTDAEGGRFYAFERFQRGALGMAGAQAAPFRVWLDGWEARALGTGLFPLRLVANSGNLGLDLRLDPGKPLVLQGNRGLSQKSARPGNASYYYSYPRLPARGRLRLAGVEFAVDGLAWMDREWSTSALEPEQVGWDWFSLQLDDGRDLMFYRLRRKDGSVDPLSAGTLVDANGGVRRIGAADVELKPIRAWRSPRGGRYPVSWHMRLPRHRLELRITPVMDAQEHTGSVRYWEGAVDVSGSAQGRVVRGRGYLELTGYARPNG